MKWENLLSLARIYVPECDSNVISDANALIIFNAAAQKFVYVAEALPTSTLFNAVAEGQTYLISTNVPSYCKPRPEGLKWYDTVNSTWVDLIGKTIEWLNQTFPQWINDSSGTPQYYSIDGDEITVYPKPSVSYASGFKLYHFKVSQDMVAGYYPFSGSATVQYPFLINFEEDLIDYYKYRAKQIMGYAQQAEEALTMFTNKALKAKTELKTRTDLKDVQASPQTRMSRGMFR